MSKIFLCVQNPSGWIAKLPAGLTLLTPLKKKDSVTSEKIIQRQIRIKKNLLRGKLSKARKTNLEQNALEKYSTHTHTHTHTYTHTHTHVNMKRQR